MWSLYKSLIELQRKHGGQRGGYGTDTGGTADSSGSPFISDPWRLEFQLLVEMFKWRWNVHVFPTN